MHEGKVRGSAMEHKSYYPKTGLTEYAVKAAELVFGLFLFSAGAYLMVQANIGLSSWWALDIGIANSTGIDYGTVHNIVALAILSGIWTPIRKKRTGCSSPALFSAASPSYISRSSRTRWIIRKAVSSSSIRRR